MGPCSWPWAGRRGLGAGLFSQGRFHFSVSKGEIQKRFPEVLTKCSGSTYALKSLPRLSAFHTYTRNASFKHLVHLIGKNLGKFSMLPSQHD